MHSRTHWLIKHISSVLVAAFSLQQVAFADPDLKPVRFDVFEKPSVHFHFPESVASIDDAYKAPSGRKTVILMQDAHTNESGQINLAKALDIILKNEKSLHYVFVEAGVGDTSLSFLRDYVSLEERKRTAMSYLRQGVLHGEEYLDLTSGLQFKLWGVEDLSLYIKALEAYRYTANQREKFASYLDKIETTIKVLKPRVYNPGLLSFDESHERFLKEAISLTDFFEVLSKEAQRRNIPLESFPHLKRLKDLKEEELKIDFKKANEEQVRAIESLSRADREELAELSKSQQSPFKLSTEEHKEGKGFYALLEEKIGNGSGPYPELSKYFRYLKAARKIKPEEILKEEKTLEDLVFYALARTPDEANLIRSSKLLKYSRKLFNLTMTPEEFEAYKRESYDFDIVHLTAFLNRKIMDLHSFYESAVFLEKGFDEIVKNAETFYAITTDRDRAFVGNMVKKMDLESQQESVLITGGYHTPNLKSLLKERGISYISVRPQVFNETNQKKYEKILLGQKLNLEQINRYIQNAPKLTSPAQSLARPWQVIETSQAAPVIQAFAPDLDYQKVLAKSAFHPELISGGTAGLMPGPGDGGGWTPSVIARSPQAPSRGARAATGRTTFIGVLVLGLISVAAVATAIVKPSFIVRAEYALGLREYRANLPSELSTKLSVDRGFREKSSMTSEIFSEDAHITYRRVRIDADANYVAKRGDLVEIYFDTIYYQYVGPQWKKNYLPLGVINEWHEVESEWQRPYIPSTVTVTFSNGRQEDYPVTKVRVNNPPYNAGGLVKTYQPKVAIAITEDSVRPVSIYYPTRTGEFSGITGSKERNVPPFKPVDILVSTPEQRDWHNDPLVNGSEDMLGGKKIGARAAQTDRDILRAEQKLSQRVPVNYRAVQEVVIRSSRLDALQEARQTVRRLNGEARVAGIAVPVTREGLVDPSFQVYGLSNGEIPDEISQIMNGIPSTSEREEFTVDVIENISDRTLVVRVYESNLVNPASADGARMAADLYVYIVGFSSLAFLVASATLVWRSLPDFKAWGEKSYSKNYDASVHRDAALLKLVAALVLLFFSYLAGNYTFNHADFSLRSPPAGETSQVAPFIARLGAERRAPQSAAYSSLPTAAGARAADLQKASAKIAGEILRDPAYATYNRSSVLLVLAAGEEQIHHIGYGELKELLQVSFENNGLSLFVSEHRAAVNRTVRVYIAARAYYDAHKAEVDAGATAWDEEALTSSMQSVNLFGTDQREVVKKAIGQVARKDTKKTGDRAANTGVVNSLLNWFSGHLRTKTDQNRRYVIYSFKPSDENMSIEKTGADFVQQHGYRESWLVDDVRVVRQFDINQTQVDLAKLLDYLEHRLSDDFGKSEGFSGLLEDFKQFASGLASAAGARAAVVETAQKKLVKGLSFTTEKVTLYDWMVLMFAKKGDQNLHHLRRLYALTISPLNGEAGHGLLTVFLMMAALQRKIPGYQITGMDEFPDPKLKNPQTFRSPVHFEDSFDANLEVLETQPDGTATLKVTVKDRDRVIAVYTVNVMPRGPDNPFSAEKPSAGTKQAAMEYSADVPAIDKGRIIFQNKEADAAKDAAKRHILIPSFEVTQEDYDSAAVLGNTTDPTLITLLILIKILAKASFESIPWHTLLVAGFKHVKGRVNVGDILTAEVIIPEADQIPQTRSGRATVPAKVIIRNQRGEVLLEEGFLKKLEDAPAKGAVGFLSPILMDETHLSLEQRSRIMRAAIRIISAEEAASESTKDESSEAMRILHERAGTQTDAALRQLLRSGKPSKDVGELEKWVRVLDDEIALRNFEFVIHEARKHYLSVAEIAKIRSAWRLAQVLYEGLPISEQDARPYAIYATSLARRLVADLNIFGIHDPVKIGDQLSAAILYGAPVQVVNSAYGKRMLSTPQMGMTPKHLQDMVVARIKSEVSPAAAALVTGEDGLLAAMVESLSRNELILEIEKQIDQTLSRERLTEKPVTLFIQYGMNGNFRASRTIEKFVNSALSWEQRVQVLSEKLNEILSETDLYVLPQVHYDAAAERITVTVRNDARSFKGFNVPEVRVRLADVRKAAFALRGRYIELFEKSDRSDDETRERNRLLSIVSFFSRTPDPATDFEGKAWLVSEFFPQHGLVWYRDFQAFADAMRSSYTANTLPNREWFRTRANTPMSRTELVQFIADYALLVISEDNLTQVALSISNNENETDKLKAVATGNVGADRASLSEKISASPAVPNIAELKILFWAYDHEKGVQFKVGPVPFAVNGARLAEAQPFAASAAFVAPIRQDLKYYDPRIARIVDGELQEDADVIRRDIKRHAYQHTIEAVLPLRFSADETIVSNRWFGQGEWNSAVSEALKKLSFFDRWRLRAALANKFRSQPILVGWVDGSPNLVSVDKTGQQPAILINRALFTRTKPTQRVLMQTALVGALRELALKGEPTPRDQLDWQRKSVQLTKRLIPDKFRLNDYLNELQEILQPNGQINETARQPLPANDSLNPSDPASALFSPQLFAIGSATGDRHVSSDEVYEWTEARRGTTWQQTYGLFARRFLHPKRSLNDMVERSVIAAILNFIVSQSPEDFNALLDHESFLRRVQGASRARLRILQGRERIEFLMKLYAPEAGKEEKESAIALAAGSYALLDVGQVFVSTSTLSDRLVPQGNPFQGILKKYGLGSLPVKSLNNVCAGFGFAYDTAQSYLKANPGQKVIVIAADAYSRMLNLTGFYDVQVFGDGATTMILGRPEKGKSISGLQVRFLPFTALWSDGNISPFIRVEHQYPFFEMNPKTVGIPFGAHVRRLIGEYLDRMGVGANDVDFIFPHQPQLDMMKTLARTLLLKYVVGVSVDLRAKIEATFEIVGNVTRVIWAGGQVANTGSNSAPMALNMSIHAMTENGQRLIDPQAEGRPLFGLLPAFGGGPSISSPAVLIMRPDEPIDVNVVLAKQAEEGDEVDTHRVDGSLNVGALLLNAATASRRPFSDLTQAATNSHLIETMERVGEAADVTGEEPYSFSKVAVFGAGHQGGTKIGQILKMVDSGEDQTIYVVTRNRSSFEAAKTEIRKRFNGAISDLMDQRLVWVDATKAADDPESIESILKNDKAQEIKLAYEIVTEDKDVKIKGVFEKVWGSRPDVNIISNTSSLSILDIARAAVKKLGLNPEQQLPRVMIQHDHTPAEKNPVDDISDPKKRAIDPRLHESVIAFEERNHRVRAHTSDKYPLFGGNRVVFGGLLSEVAASLADGYSPEAIHEATKGSDDPMVDRLYEVSSHYKTRLAKVGFDPIQMVTKAVGADVAVEIMRNYELYYHSHQHDLDPAKYGVFLDVVYGRVDESHFRYTPKTMTRAQKAELRERMWLALAAEAFRIQSDGVFRHPRWLDLAFVKAFGANKETGGIFQAVDDLGPIEVLRRLEDLSREPLHDHLRPTEEFQHMALSGANFERTIGWPTDMAATGTGYQHTTFKDKFNETRHPAVDEDLIYALPAAGARSAVARQSREELLQILHIITRAKPGKLFRLIDTAIDMLKKDGINVSRRDVTQILSKIETQLQEHQRAYFGDTIIYNADHLLFRLSNIRRRFESNDRLVKPINLQTVSESIEDLRDIRNWNLSSVTRSRVIRPLGAAIRMLNGEGSIAAAAKSVLRAEQALNELVAKYTGRTYLVSIRAVRLDEIARRLDVLNFSSIVENHDRTELDRIKALLRQFRATRARLIVAFRTAPEARTGAELRHIQVLIASYETYRQQLETLPHVSEVTGALERKHEASSQLQAQRLVSYAHERQLNIQLLRKSPFEEGTQPVGNPPQGLGYLMLSYHPDGAVKDEWSESTVHLIPTLLPQGLPLQPLSVGEDHRGIWFAVTDETFFHAVQTALANGARAAGTEQALPSSGFVIYGVHEIRVKGEPVQKILAGLTDLIQAYPEELSDIVVKVNDDRLEMTAKGVEPYSSAEPNAEGIAAFINRVDARPATQAIVHDLDRITWSGAPEVFWMMRLIKAVLREHYGSAADTVYEMAKKLQAPLKAYFPFQDPRTVNPQLRFPNVERYYFSNSYIRYLLAQILWQTHADHNGLRDILSSVVHFQEVVRAHPNALNIREYPSEWRRVDFDTKGSVRFVHETVYDKYTVANAVFAVANHAKSVAEFLDLMRSLTQAAERGDSVEQVVKSLGMGESPSAGARAAIYGSGSYLHYGDDTFEINGRPTWQIAVDLETLFAVHPEISRIKVRVHGDGSLLLSTTDLAYTSPAPTAAAIADFLKFAVGARAAIPDKAPLPLFTLSEPVSLPIVKVGPRFSGLFRHTFILNDPRYLVFQLNGLARNDILLGPSRILFSLTDDGKIKAEKFEEDGKTVAEIHTIGPSDAVHLKLLLNAWSRGDIFVNEIEHVRMAHVSGRQTLPLYDGRYFIDKFKWLQSLGLIPINSNASLGIMRPSGIPYLIETNRGISKTDLDFEKPEAFIQALNRVFAAKPGARMADVSNDVVELAETYLLTKAVQSSGARMAVNPNEEAFNIAFAMNDRLADHTWRKGDLRKLFAEYKFDFSNSWHHVLVRRMVKRINHVRNALARTGNLPGGNRTFRTMADYIAMGLRPFRLQPGKKPGTLTFGRHGESTRSDTGPGGGQFTGHRNVPLSERGLSDALTGGKSLRRVYPNLRFSAVFTSMLFRAQETVVAILDGMGHKPVPIFTHPAINERHYGALQDQFKKAFETSLVDRVLALLAAHPDLIGKSPKEISKALKEEWELAVTRPTTLPVSEDGAKQLAAKVFELWRRNWDDAPPMDETGFTESLKSVYERAVPFFDQEIMPAIENGEDVLVAAHGNSQRAILKRLIGLTDEEVSQNFTFPLATPVRFYFNEDGSVQRVEIVHPETGSPDPDKLGQFLKILDMKHVKYEILDQPPAGARAAGARTPSLQSLNARYVPDSRGQTTIEVDVILKMGRRIFVGRGSVLAGASTGVREVDINKEAVETLKEVIAPALFAAIKKRQVNIASQKSLSNWLKKLDGTHKLSTLGGNTILALLWAMADAMAQAQNIPVHEYWTGEYTKNPNPIYPPAATYNVLNGGAHGSATTKEDIQETQVVVLSTDGQPVSAEFQNQKMQTVNNALKAELKARKLATTYGDEGGYSPEATQNEQYPQYLKAAVDGRTSLKWGINLAYAFDFASSEFFDEETGEYVLRGEGAPIDVSTFSYFQKVVDRDVHSDKPNDERLKSTTLGRMDSRTTSRSPKEAEPVLVLSRREWVAYVQYLVLKYPIFSIEDAATENDWRTARMITQALEEDREFYEARINRQVLEGESEEYAAAIRKFYTGRRIWHLGDDPTTTNKDYIHLGIAGSEATEFFERIDNTTIRSKETGRVIDLKEIGGFVNAEGRYFIPPHTYNAFLLKFNQAGTTDETLEVAIYALSEGALVSFSHRSGAAKDWQFIHGAYTATRFVHRKSTNPNLLNELKNVLPVVTIKAGNITRERALDYHRERQLIEEEAGLTENPAIVRPVGARAAATGLATDGHQQALLLTDLSREVYKLIKHGQKAWPSRWGAYPAGSEITRNVLEDRFIHLKTVDEIAEARHLNLDTVNQNLTIGRKFVVKTFTEKYPKISKEEVDAALQGVAVFNEVTGIERKPNLFSSVDETVNFDFVQGFVGDIILAAASGKIELRSLRGNLGVAYHSILKKVGRQADPRRFAEVFSLLEKLILALFDKGLTTHLEGILKEKIPALTEAATGPGLKRALELANQGIDPYDDVSLGVKGARAAGLLDDIRASLKNGREAIEESEGHPQYLNDRQRMAYESFGFGSFGRVGGAQQLWAGVSSKIDYIMSHFSTSGAFIVPGVDRDELILAIQALADALDYFGNALSDKPKLRTRVISAAEELREYITALSAFPITIPKMRPGARAAATVAEVRDLAKTMVGLNLPEAQLTTIVQILEAVVNKYWLSLHRAVEMALLSLQTNPDGLPNQDLLKNVPRIHLARQAGNTAIRKLLDEFRTSAADVGAYRALFAALRAEHNRAIYKIAKAGQLHIVPTEILARSDLAKDIRKVDILIQAIGRLKQSQFQIIRQELPTIGLSLDNGHVDESGFSSQVARAIYKIKDLTWDDIGVINEGLNALARLTNHEPKIAAQKYETLLQTMDEYTRRGARAAATQFYLKQARNSVDEYLISRTNARRLVDEAALPLASIEPVVGNSNILVVHNMDHKRIAVVKYLIHQLSALKSLGFKYVALDIIPSSFQSIINGDDFKTNRSLKEAVAQRLRSDSGLGMMHIEDEADLYLAFVSLARKTGLTVIAIGNDRLRFHDDPARLNHWITKLAGRDYKQGRALIIVPRVFSHLGEKSLDAALRSEGYSVSLATVATEKGFDEEQLIQNQVFATAGEFVRGDASKYFRVSLEDQARPFHILYVGQMPDFLELRNLTEDASLGAASANEARQTPPLPRGARAALQKGTPQFVAAANTVATAILRDKDLDPVALSGVLSNEKLSRSGFMGVEYKVKYKDVGRYFRNQALEMSNQEHRDAVRLFLFAHVFYAENKEAIAQAGDLGRFINEHLSLVREKMQSYGFDIFPIEDRTRVLQVVQAVANMERVRESEAIRAQFLLYLEESATRAGVTVARGNAPLEEVFHQIASALSKTLEKDYRDAVAAKVGGRPQYGEVAVVRGEIDSAYHRARQLVDGFESTALTILQNNKNIEEASSRFDAIFKETIEAIRALDRITSTESAGGTPAVSVAGARLGVRQQSAARRTSFTSIRRSILSNIRMADRRMEVVRDSQPVAQDNRKPFELVVDEVKGLEAAAEADIAVTDFVSENPARVHDQLDRTARYAATVLISLGQLKQALNVHKLQREDEAGRKAYAALSLKVTAAFQNIKRAQIQLPRAEVALKRILPREGASGARAATVEDVIELVKKAQTALSRVSLTTTSEGISLTEATREIRDILLYLKSDLGKASVGLRELLAYFSTYMAAPKFESARQLLAEAKTSLDGISGARLASAVEALRQKNGPSRELLNLEAQHILRVVPVNSMLERPSPGFEIQKPVNEGPAPLAPIVQEFLTNVGNALLSNSGARLALAQEGEVVRIYDLIRRPNELLVEVGKASYTLDLSTGKFVEARQTEAREILLNQGLTDRLGDILSANRLGSISTQMDLPAVFLVHAQSFLDAPKTEFDNLLLRQSALLSKGSVVGFLGNEDEVKRALALVSELRLRNASQYKSAEAISPDLKQAPHVLLIKQGYEVSGLDFPHLYRITLANDTTDQAGVFAFAAVQAIMIRLAQGDMQGAFDIYHSLNPHSTMSFETFKQSSISRIGILLLPTVWASFREAVRLYQLSRIADIYA